MTTITDQSSLPAALSPSSSSPSSSSPPSSSPSSSSPSSSSPFSSVCFSSVSPSSSLPSSSVSSASLSSLASGGKLPGSETSEESLPHQQGAEPRVSLEATMCSPSPEKTGPPCSPCPESCGKQEGNNTDPCTVSSPCESRGSRRTMETARAGASSGKAEDEHARAEGGEPAQGTHEARDKEKSGDRRPASGPGGSELDKMEKEDGKTFPSKLDFFDANSDLARSDFRGVAVLLFIAAIFYLVANPILRWYDSKEFVDPSLARAMFDDFFFLMFMWAKLFAWSFTAYHLHLLYLRGRISRRALLFLQHLTQSAAIGYAVCSCLYNAWPIIPAAFVQMIAVVQFMKMHSYSSTNMNFCDDMRQGKQTLGYPENVTLRNFCDYLFCPVLVYEPMYRRGGGFRPTYFVFKLFSMVGAMVVMYLACTSYLIPTMMRSPSMSITEAIFSLVFPFLFLDILIFYILFECICNLAAEITNFANRNFYDDWWNSTNWDEYSRKWNKPVHRFLLRHVYMETQQRYKWSHQTAAFATFLFSALLHEMILVRNLLSSPLPFSPVTGVALCSSHVSAGL
ncbi:acyl-CoA:cholesterol acyltransferase alpha ACAT1-alpha [Toxoplasma gondii GAB2-2007-GAL-DOM2]|uniref:Acyl-CoA:cholesterol acyltransferase alpha ACAT1-alpha n=1 Tax=Toxoplasma gondii GAB2-2007-GAL-DOM2 TaxID=1130820 RepID=A0A086JFB1_TOXGO|nr:acyl-CoA:cholesterol acyltransferase alpha ACAT1-alpha [Toxoplasma gondii GAB2-2007-GAL-DOM2]